MDALRLAIVGTGPGCMAVTEADLEGRTVCAVNQAVNVLERAEILAFQDPIEMVMMTLTRFRFREVWCNLSSVRAAQTFFSWATVKEGADLQARIRLGRWVTPEPLPAPLAEAIGNLTMPPGLADFMRERGIQPQIGRPEDGKVFERYGKVIPSMAMALITAGVMGYRDIVVYGAEMRGSGSPARVQSANPDTGTPIQGYQEEALPAFEDRWRRERWLFAAAVRHLRDYYRCRVRRVVRIPALVP